MTSAPPPAAPFLRKSRRSSLVAAPAAGNIEASVTARMKLSGGYGLDKTTRWLSEVFAANGETPNALLRCGVDRVAQSGRDDRQTGLADSRGLLLAHDHVDFRFRSAIHAWHFVIVKIGL